MNLKRYKQLGNQIKQLLDEGEEIPPLLMQEWNDCYENILPEALAYIADRKVSFYNNNNIFDNIKIYKRYNKH